MGQCLWKIAQRFATDRNFFGVKAVLHLERGTVLQHGRTIHGTQSAAPEVRDEPTMYYRRESGIGLLLASGSRD